MAGDQNQQEAERWLRQAGRDLDAARASMRSGFHEWGCFLAQQAAEKALKAFLYAQGERAVIGHSILRLIERARVYEGGFADLADAKRLDEVYIPSRYPNGLEETTPGDFYTEEDARLCIGLAQRVLERVSALVAI